MFAQGLPLQQFHRDEGMAFVFVKVVNGADVLMVQHRNGSRLALESLPCQWIKSDLFWQELQGYEAAELQIFRTVHQPHASAANDLEDPVVRELLAG